jgi:cysteinyl-tRNA synthetase
MVDGFYDAMNDDFNAPMLIANLFEAVKYINSVNDGKVKITKDDLELLSREMKSFVFDVLGIAPLTGGDDSKLNGVMDLVLDLRQKARSEKDWGTSDQIRDGLAAAGVVVKDSKDGSTWN